MKWQGIATGLVTMALVAGCATPGGNGTRAPIEERGPSAARAKRPVPEIPPKAQMPPHTARAPDRAAASPPRAVMPRPSGAPPSQTESARRGSAATAPALPPRGASAPKGPRSISPDATAPAGSTESRDDIINAPDADPLPSATESGFESGAAASAPPLPPMPEDDVHNGQASPPVLALVNLAQQQIERGQAEAGAATLERALAIEPQNPHLWHRLARLRLQQGALSPAAELAAKSNLYAAAVPALQVRNWRLIAEVRERQGDGARARDAYRRAELAEELAR